MDEKTTETETEQAQNTRFSESHRATYSPESNKLYLYVGRVPREEYLALRAQGWKALHKQREAGGGDFVATWTPERRNTALEYAGIIEDEDMGPEERAADRAERFGGYRDKRLGEAGERADSYDAGPSAHGFQSEARAERAVRRHDRLASRSVDAWDKAEYWQQRTAGVIAHALYKSSPSCRMGRIKELETDLRRCTPGGEWHKHLTLRLAYENQMIEAVGGRASLVEMEVGGWIGSYQIRKVVKSPVTKQVVSVEVMAPHRRFKEGSLVPVVAPILMNIERHTADEYKAPTEDDKKAMAAILAAERKERKASAPPTIPLINPTDEDAERLQAIWNKANADKIKYYDKPTPAVARMTQAEYSARAGGGSYSRFKTVEITGGGFEKKDHYMRRVADCPVVAKVRAYDGIDARVVIITDKPQKPFAENVWHDPRPEIKARLERDRLALEKAMGAGWLPESGTPERELMEQGGIVGLVYISSMSQYGYTEAGHAWAQALREKEKAPNADAFKVQAELLPA